MIDPQLADRLYNDAMRHTGRPPLTATYDRRFLIPLDAFAGTLSVALASVNPAAAPVNEGRLRDFASKRWVTILPGAETEHDPNAPGLPFYALDRLRTYLELSAAGFTDAELAAHAEFEEGLIDAILAADALAYEDDDLAQLLLDEEDLLRMDEYRLANFDERQRRARETGSPFADSRKRAEADVARGRRNFDYLRSLDRARLSDADRVRLGRCAYRVRARNEGTRAFLAMTYYEQMRAGYSFFICFSEEGFGEAGWYCRGLQWAASLHDPAVTEETSRFPLRVPGFVLEGHRITPTRTLAPDEYAHLWEASDLDEYRNVLKLVWSEKECPHCRYPVRRDAAPTRVYCSNRCADAARQARYRERHPDAVKYAQNRWRRG